MKKIMLMISIIGCMFLVACGGNDLKDSDVKETETSGVSEVLLYNDQGLKLTMKAVKSVEGNRNIYTVYMTNDNDQERSVYLSEWLINDTYIIGEPETLYLDPLSDYKGTMDEMTTVAYTENLDAIHSIHFHIMVRDEEYEVIDEQDIDIDLEEGFVFDVDYNTFLDAKATEQVLVDDEQKKVTLIEWGRNLSNNYIEAVVCMENKSDETIPVMISGMSINGIYFRVSERVNFLKPGQKCYANCYLTMSEIEDEGITSITDVGLMILTDESQNTGTVSYAGGEWYPIVLDEKGESSEAFVTGEPLEVLEDVHISYIGQEGNDWSNGGGYYQWKLAVVNDGDENVKLSIIDVLIDGIPEESWHEDMSDCSLYMADSEVGANSSRYVYISLSYYAEKIPRPELNFKFQLRSMAGGAVIDTGEDTITITPDKE